MSNTVRQVVVDTEATGHSYHNELSFYTQEKQKRGNVRACVRCELRCKLLGLLKDIMRVAGGRLVAPPPFRRAL